MCVGTTQHPVGAKHHTPPNLVFVHHIVVSGWSCNRNNHKETSHTYSSGKRKVHVAHPTNGDRAPRCNYGAFALPLHTLVMCVHNESMSTLSHPAVQCILLYKTIHTYTHSRHSPEDTSRNERERNKRTMPWQVCQ